MTTHTKKKTNKQIKTPGSFPSFLTKEKRSKWKEEEIDLQLKMWQKDKAEPVQFSLQVQTTEPERMWSELS